jgi:hypothetical protein
MKPNQAIASIALLFFTAIASTVIGMKVSQRADYVDTLATQIKDDETRIQVLRTELAYLSSPQRVQALVNLHRPDLTTPDSRQYVLKVEEVLPQQPVQANTQLAVIKNASRQQADRLIAISLPKVASISIAPSIASSPAQPVSIADPIESLIAIADAAESKMVRLPGTQQGQSHGLSTDLQMAVQNVANKDVLGR